MQRLKKLEGSFLIAMPNMGDSRFAKSLIYLCAHSAEGAMGFVINRRMEHPTAAEFLAQLNIVTETEEAELSDRVCAACRCASRRSRRARPGFRPAFAGIPNRRRRCAIDEGICLTATLEILRAIATGDGPRQVMLALGYSGWAGGQLEDEIVANGWLTSPADGRSGVRSPADDTKYELALLRHGHRSASAVGGGRPRLSRDQISDVSWVLTSVFWHLASGI